MLLEAFKFEECVDFVEGFPGDRFDKINYELGGSGIELRVIDVRTYGGAVRLYLGDNGEPIDTGSITTPMRIKRPFRLAPMSAYVIHFHLALKELPKNVVARIIPTETMAKLGILFTDMHVTEGALQVTAVPLRMVEVTEGYPLALLTFIEKECDETTCDDEKDENTNENANANANANKSPKKGKKNAKNSSTRK